MASKLPKVSIIGAGTVGNILTSILHERNYPIVSVIDANGARAVECARHVKCKRASTQISDIAPASEIIIIAVNDTAIEDVAINLSKIKKLNFKKLLAVHTSGVHSADVLQSLKKKGAQTGSMHPIQTFPAYQKPAKLRSRMKGIYFGIDGYNGALPRIEKLVEECEAHPVIIAKELRPLYHTACVFASNYLTVFLNVVNQLALKLHLKASWMEVFGPLMTASMENVIAASATEALTGPIVRGDMATLDLHLNVLAQHAPQFLPLYTVGGIEAARIAKESGRIKQEDYQAILTKFKKFIQSTSFKPQTKVKR